MGVGLLSVLFLVIGGLSASFALLARAISRRMVGPSNAALSPTKTVAVGVGCFLMTCLLIAVGWFLFVIWAFKDFHLF